MNGTYNVVHVSLVNEDKGYIFSEWTENLDDNETSGYLYRLAQREYGRCQSSVYIDTNKGTKKIGWFFIKRERYSDSDDTYLQGAWVTIDKRDEDGE